MVNQPFKIHLFINMESLVVYLIHVEMSVATTGPLNPEGTWIHVLPFNGTAFVLSLKIIDFYASIDIMYRYVLLITIYVSKTNISLFFLYISHVWCIRLFSNQIQLQKFYHYFLNIKKIINP